MSYVIFYSVLHGDQSLQRKMYAQIGSEVILTCKISKEISTQSWRKHNTQLTRGFKKNERFFGHERLEIINDRGFYNLKINNITEYDFSTYWCETQQGNSIRVEVTRLINSGNTINIEHKEFKIKCLLKSIRHYDLKLYILYEHRLQAILNISLLLSRCLCIFFSL